MNWMLSRINLLSCFIVLAILLCFASPALAQQGSEIFEGAACNLLERVLGEHFGAMLTVLTGFLAIVASVAGSFRAAWALVFVSVGCFVMPSLVGVLFPGLGCAGPQG